MQLPAAIRKLLAPRSGAHQHQALAEFNRSLALIVDLEQLQDSVLAAFRDLLSARSASLFLQDSELGRFQLTAARGLEPLADSRPWFAADGSLVRWFTANETHLTLKDHPDILAFFTDQERGLLDRLAAELILPLVSMNRLIGLVCLGGLPRGRKGLPERAELLRALAGQCALAMENALLYRQQQDRLKKMYRADRLATLGQLAAGAAHEIRNPLTSIRSTIQYLQKDTHDAARRELIEGLIGEVDRINGIIEGLLSFSRPVSPELCRVELRALLEQALSLVAATAHERGIALELEYAAPSSELEADPSLLKQVFLNLLLNALEAGGAGAIRVRVEGRPRGFHLQFRDDGPGIPPENLERVFDPFFTTKRDGTGLGLSICYGIIHRHGGEIEIDSRTAAADPAGHGTVVTISLPARCRVKPEPRGGNRP